MEYYIKYNSDHKPIAIETVTTMGSVNDAGIDGISFEEGLDKPKIIWNPKVSAKEYADMSDCTHKDKITCLHNGICTNKPCSYYEND